MTEQSFDQQIATETGVTVAHDTRLTSSEISNLWQTCMYFSMMQCVYKYFKSNVDNPDIGSLLEYCIGSFTTRVNLASKFLADDKLPVPNGFGDEDVDLKAPRLYSDSFYLYYIRNMVRFGIQINGVALTMASRPDIRKFYTDVVHAVTNIWERTADLLLAKGLFIRSPYITVEDHVDYVKKQTFLRGFLGEKRPLLAVEVEQLFYNMIANGVGMSLLTGFRQVIRSPQARSYMERGISMAEKNVDTFSAILRKEDISSPLHWDTFVTDSTTPPFSDKLMMNHVVKLDSLSIVNYALSLSNSLRHDVSTAFARVMAEATGYAEDGINIVIENGWFEEPPRVVDRRELVNEPRH